MTGIPYHGRRLALVFILMLLIASCGGLAGEPQIVATLPPQTPPPPDVGYPLAAPNLAQGAEIYAARCVRCHGTGGQGDGELVLSGQIKQRPRDFTDPATTRELRPADWFATITNGRLENGMPPWRSALNEQERWAVALYTYTLSYSRQQLELGQQVWAANCASCHGETGRGDGPEATEIARPLGDFTQQSEVVNLSDQEFYTIATEGIGEMKGFADTLDDESRRAVAAYARTLALANTATIGQEAQPQPATTAEVQQASAQGAVTGRVTNGTAASTVPTDLTVTLYSHAGGNFNQQDTAINPDGTFSFGDVAIDAGTSYFVGAVYRDRQFFSEPVTGDPAAPNIDLTLTLYEPTEDPSVVSIGEMIIVVQPSTNAVAGDGLEIQHLFAYQNNSDRMYTTSREVGDKLYASLLVSLPPGSVILDTNSTRFILAQDQYAVIDTAPVMPGPPHLVEVHYFMPYTDGAIIELPLNNAFTGDLRIALWPDSLQIKSDQVVQSGTVTIQGHPFRLFEGQVDLKPGGVVRYELSGQAFAATTSAPAAISGNVLLPVVLIVLGIGLLVFGGAIFLRDRRRAGADKGRMIELLVRQAAELDEAHERGQINHDYYQQQRKQLKVRLAQLMGEEKG